MALISRVRRCGVMASLVAVLACSDDDGGDVRPDDASQGDAQVNPADGSSGEPWVSRPDAATGPTGGYQDQGAGAAGDAAGSGSADEPDAAAGSCGAPAPDIRADGCSDQNPVTLMAALMPSASDENVVPIATSVVVTYPDAGSGEPITLTFTVSGALEGTLAVVRAAPDQTVSMATALKPETKGQQVTVRVSDSGTYTLVGTPKPPNDCAEKTLSANVDAQTNEDLAMLDGVTHLVGNLGFKGMVSDLRPLKCLTFIDGSVEATSAGMLTQLALPGVVRIQGRVRLSGLRALTELSLPRLRAIGRGTDGASLDLSQLTELSAVDARSLVDVPGQLKFVTLGATGDAPLTLHFEALTTLGSSLTLSGLKTLQNLRGWANLSDVRGHFDLDNTDQLTTLLGLSRLQHVAGGVTLAANRGLFAAALDGLTVVDGGLTIKDHPFVTSVDLHALSKLGAKDGASLTVTGLPKLTHFAAPKLSDASAQLSFMRMGDTADAALELSFPGLVTLHGDLTLSQLKTLENLDGFAALTTLEGSLSLSADDKLETLGGLAKLTTILGQLSLETNKALREAGLGALTKLGGQLNVKDDSALTTLDLHALTSLGSSAGVSMTLSGLSALSKVDLSSLAEIPASVSLLRLGDRTEAALELGLTQLTALQGDLTVSMVKTLRTLDGLQKLTSIAGKLALDNDPGLDTVVLPALTTLGGGIAISNDLALSQIDLHALTQLGVVGAVSLALTGLPKLTNLDLQALTNVAGDLSISRADDLTTLSGFGQLARIGGQLSVDNNAALTTLAFPALTEVAGRVYLANAAALTSVDLSKLTTVGMTGGYSVNLLTLPRLTSLNLKALADVPGQLNLTRIGDTASTALALDLSALTSVRGALTLSAIKNLPNVDSFAKLTSVGGTLAITSNPGLTSLMGFAALESVTGTVQITGNAALSTCLAKELALTIKGMPSGSSVSGNLVDNSCLGNGQAGTGGMAGGPAAGSGGASGMSMAGSASN